jgi:predicted dehydrogenase
MSSASKVRFAVIGAGVIGDVHAQAIRSLPDVAELSLVAAPGRNPVASGRPDESLNRPGSVEAVVCMG